MRRLISVCTIGAALAASPTALAKDPPVFVDPDPDSPAGTEYAIPLDEARGDADGKSGSSNGAAPLFGEGISSRGDAAGAGAAGGSGGDGSGSGGSGSGGSGGSDGSRASGSGADFPDASGVPAASEGGGSTTALTIGIPLAVLALGGAIALAVISVRSLRREPSGTPS